MKAYHNFLTLCLMLLSTIVFSQQIEPQDYERKLTYTEFETDYYLIDQNDLDRVSIMDKVKLKELKYEKEYEKFINENDERTTIIRHISSEGTYEDWMNEPEIVVIDKEGVSLYSNKGARINQIDHAPKYLELAKNIGSDLLPVIAFPSREDINNMKKRGMRVEELGNNFIQVSFNYQQIIFNEDLLSIEINDLNENGEIMHRLNRVFMQLPGGEIVCERIRESTIEILSNDVRAEHVFLRYFSNYRIENTYSKFPKASANQSLKVVLNSNQSSAKIEYEPFSKLNSTNITIYSIGGRAIKTIYTDHSGKTQMDITDLAPGVYIMRIQSSGKTLSEKFVKM